MTKYIQDTIRNNLRSVVAGLTRPQEKAVQAMVRGLFTAGTPVLRHLAQDETKSAKKQGEKYGHHLERVELKSKVENVAFRKAKQLVRKTTIIAYDLTDIAKPAAQQMEKISRVRDGSANEICNGYLIHGVGINNVLTRFEVHDSEGETTNQVRKRTVRELTSTLERKGIWVFDRGNDDKQFYVDLRQELMVQFMVRVRENRHVVLKETGEYIAVKNIPPGKYRVYLLDKHNHRVDMQYEYLLVVSRHMEDKEPIRLLSNLDYHLYTEEELVTMYLERWGVENLFKRVKDKFDLEKIRVFSHPRFVNLIALIQLAAIVSTITFQRIQQTTNVLITGVLLCYKRFIKLKHLSFCIDSFITYMQSSLEPLIIRVHKPPILQLAIFSRRQLVKLGTI